jgi:CRISPR-associated endonuclease/helicase Cas3
MYDDASVRPAIARAKRDGQDWDEQLLVEHLLGVAALAHEFAAPFGASGLAFLAGIWHDLGKFAADWQAYIRDAIGMNRLDVEDAHLEEENRGRRGPDHSAAGALHAIEKLGPTGHVLAQLIAAHHAGLYDSIALKDRLDQPRTIARLDAAKNEHIPDDILNAHRSHQPTFDLAPASDASRCAYALWLRMLFSALIDADRINSEEFGDGGRARKIRNSQPKLRTLKPDFDTFMGRFSVDTPVNRLRAEILDDCRAAAKQPQGLFKLSVPTGGGKTLASLAFALEHAAHHADIKRVIYVIPYTSIIEQTADVFRNISPAFASSVVEHHSNAEESPDGRESERARLAAENWDAPLIVTTSVQFLESLFAARTSRCRKLHNICDSVVILDEVQLLPPAFLQPIVDALTLLKDHYRTTLVLSTATQPALASASHFGSSFRGLDGAREIVANVDGNYKELLKRTSVRLPADFNSRVSFHTLAERVIAENADVLVIVNRRAEARDLLKRLPRGSMHLSALMCGAHRSNTINQIKQLLAARREDPTLPPLCIVSTQLVECGVDLDLPVVYRAFAGLDSIAQAAGRCNREGKLASGRVEVFIGEKDAPKGSLQKGEAAAKEILHGYHGHPLDRALFEPYFRLYYDSHDRDAKGIGKLLEIDEATCGVVGLRSAADAFKMIDNDETGYRSIYVPYRSNEEDRTFESLLAMLKREGPQRWLLRKLQRFSVSLPPHEFGGLSKRQDIEEAWPSLWFLRSAAQYSPDVGLVLTGEALDAAALSV